MERNENAETTNKMLYQIYGLRYLVFLSICSGIRLLISAHDLYLQDIFFYRIAKSAKLNIYFQHIFSPLEEINY